MEFSSNSETFWSCDFVYIRAVFDVCKYRLSIYIKTNLLQIELLLPWTKIMNQKQLCMFNKAQFLMRSFIQIFGFE